MHFKALNLPKVQGENCSNSTNLCQGKAQKGHLAFEAAFESANLGRVDFVHDTEYDIYIRPDTCNPRHRFVFATV